MLLEVNGRRAYAYTGGRPYDAALPCVVLVHGALGDHSVWGLQSRYLAHHGRSVLAVDLPGHGRSEGPALESVEALRDWLLALLQACGATRPALVGHSLGSLIALEAAAALGEAAAALVMVGTAYPMRVSADLLDTARRSPDEAMRRVNQLEHSTHAAKPSAPGPGSWLHGTALALKRRQFEQHARHHPGSNLFVADFTACDRYAGALEAAARVRCPVHLVMGKRDVMTPPRSAADLARALRASSVSLPAGHALMSEAPDALLAALLDALARTISA